MFLCLLINAKCKINLLFWINYNYSTLISPDSQFTAIYVQLIIIIKNKPL